jgi:hypothetical protein
VQNSLGTVSEPFRSQDLVSKFKLQLKDDLMNASFSSKHLAYDDYNQFFRDAYFEIQDGVMLVGGVNRERVAEGLKKYERRLKTTFEQVAGVGVDFRLAPAQPGERESA